MIENWVEQTKPSVLFVDWGVLKDKHNAEEAVVVKEGEHITGVVTDIKEIHGVDEDTMRHSFRLKTKEHKKELFIYTNTSLEYEMFGDDKNNDELFIPVKMGDEIRITNAGTYKTKMGKTCFRLKVAVNRGDSK